MKWMLLSATLMLSIAGMAQQKQSRAVAAQMDPVHSFNFSMEPDGDSAFVLKIDNPEMKKLSVWIRHAQLGSALDTTISSASYGCRCLFDKAQDGRYIITVSNGKERVEREFRLNTVTVVNRQITLL